MRLTFHLARFVGACCSLALLVAAIASPISADMREDIIIQHGDDQYRRATIDHGLYERLSALLGAGYPPASVILHGVSMGVPIDDVVEMTVRANPEDAAKVYDIAASMLPSLPGWACRAVGTSPWRQGQLGAGAFDGKTVAQVADAYFNGGLRAQPIPDWQNGDFHIEADVEEIVGLSTHDAHWYRGLVANTASVRPVFVSLYRDRQAIVIDADSQRLAARQAAGKVPVVFLFNDVFQRPVSDYREDTDVETIAEDFFAGGYELTAVPDWQQGDYHLMANVDELDRLFGAPELASMSLETRNALAADADSTAPIKITLLREGAQLWIDQPERLSAAMAAGKRRVPVVFYYHGFDRLACGVSASSCLQHVCRGVIDGGGDPSICQRYTGPDGKPLTPPGVAGIGGFSGIVGTPALPPPPSSPPSTIAPPPTASPN